MKKLLLVMSVLLMTFQLTAQEKRVSGVRIYERWITSRKHGLWRNRRILGQNSRTKG